MKTLLICQASVVLVVVLNVFYLEMQNPVLRAYRPWTFGIPYLACTAFQVWLYHEEIWAYFRSLGTGLHAAYAKRFCRHTWTKWEACGDGSLESLHDYRECKNCEWGQIRIGRKVRFSRWAPFF